jgi:hypothetical protein
MFISISFLNWLMVESSNFDDHATSDQPHDGFQDRRWRGFIPGELLKARGGLQRVFKIRWVGGSAAGCPIQHF